MWNIITPSGLSRRPNLPATIVLIIWAPKLLTVWILQMTTKNRKAYLANKLLTRRSLHRRNMFSKPYVSPLPTFPVKMSATTWKGIAEATSSMNHEVTYLFYDFKKCFKHSDDGRRMWYIAILIETNWLSSLWGTPNQMPTNN